MAYRLSLEAPLAENITGILAGEMGRAISVLQTTGQFSKSVHNARKSFKRARAALHLARPLMKPKVFKRYDRRIAVAARGLSHARDAQVILDAARGLEQANRDNGNDALFTHLISWLQARLERTRHSEGTVAVGATLTALENLRDDVSRLPLEDATFDVLLHSARQTYAQGRAFMREALDSEDDERCHDWRKLVQRHWRHMALFQEAWPAEAKARMGLARDLAEALGQHHDLSVLRVAIFENAALFPLRRDVKKLAALIEARQADLLAEAGVLGERLFAEKPKAFFRRMGVYWDTAKLVRRGVSTGTLAARP
jgi:CHAD domain-containing protein